MSLIYNPVIFLPIFNSMLIKGIISWHAILNYTSWQQNVVLASGNHTFFLMIGLGAAALFREVQFLHKK